MTICHIMKKNTDKLPILIHRIIFVIIIDIINKTKNINMIEFSDNDEKGKKPNSISESTTPVLDNFSRDLIRSKLYIILVVFILSCHISHNLYVIIRHTIKCFSQRNAIRNK